MYLNIFYTNLCKEPATHRFLFVKPWLIYLLIFLGYTWYYIKEQNYINHVNELFARRIDNVTCI